MSPYMTNISRARPEKAREIEACVHVDGTSRAQTVFAENSGGLFRILNHFYQLTGTPIVLNTSLNVNNEPIIASESEAISFFLSTPIEALVIGDILIQR
jgi:carbamoyltransferase